MLNFQTRTKLSAAIESANTSAVAVLTAATAAMVDTTSIELLAVTLPAVTLMAWVPVVNPGTMIDALKSPLVSVAGAGDGFASIPPTVIVVTETYDGKLVPDKVKDSPVDCWLRSDEIPAPGSACVAVFELPLAAVPVTVFVDGIEAVVGTTKEPDQLPRASAVEVPTVTAVEPLLV